MSYINNKYIETHKIINNILYKQCRDCKKWLVTDLNNFNTNNKNKDKLNDRCKSCQKKYNQYIYNKNKEKRKQYQREYYWKDPETDHKRCKKRYEQNYEYYLNKSRRLRNSPNCKYPEKEAEWRKNHPEKIKQYNTYRKEHKTHEISKEEWISCKNYFNNSCAYCGVSNEKAKKITGNYLHKEHVDHEGANDLSNCIPACKSCNSSKRANNIETWFKKQKFFTQEKLNKIYKWLDEDYKSYINK